MALIRSLRDRGLAILLVEHHIRVVMGVSDRVFVLNHGERIAEGRQRRFAATRRSSPRISERAREPRSRAGPLSLSGPAGQNQSRGPAQTLAFRGGNQRPGLASLWFLDGRRGE